jgi:hypothetical protein
VAGLTLAELEAKKAQLQSELYSGIEEIQVHGVRTIRRSVEDIQAALAALEAEIAGFGDVPTSSCIRTSLRTGHYG